MYTASVSTFAERHSAWWFNAGFNETINVGCGGDEIAQDVTPAALDWLSRNQGKDWFLHVHYWDPHGAYRTPREFGNPFEGEPSEAIDWVTPEVLEEHRQMAGFHTAREISGFTDRESLLYPRQPGKIDTVTDVRRNVDGYDCGIRNADNGVALLLDKLRSLGQYDNTAIIVTSDHGEDMGELGRYCEHGCADYPVMRIPMIIKWPGAANGAKAAELHQNIDLIPTLLDLLGDIKVFPYEEHVKETFGPNYKAFFKQMLLGMGDGRSFAGTVRTGKDEKGYDYLVLSLCTHTIQRTVRFKTYIYIRTYHDGYCLFDDDMLFDVVGDPHETRNLAQSRPDLVHEGAYLLEKWVSTQMKANAKDGAPDPLWTSYGEGGGYHILGQFNRYIERLRSTGREKQAEELLKKYPQPKK